MSLVMPPFLSGSSLTNSASVVIRDGLDGETLIEIDVGVAGAAAAAVRQRQLHRAVALELAQPRRPCIHIVVR